MIKSCKSYLHGVYSKFIEYVFPKIIVSSLICCAILPFLAKIDKMFGNLIDVFVCNDKANIFVIFEVV